MCSIFRHYDTKIILKNFKCDECDNKKGSICSAYALNGTKLRVLNKLSVKMNALNGYGYYGPCNKNFRCIVILLLISTYEILNVNDTYIYT